MFEQLKTYFEYSLLYSHIFREMNVTLLSEIV